MRIFFTLLIAAMLLSPLAASAAETPRQHLNHSADSELPFSNAVLVGNTLYISGSLGFEPGTTNRPEDPADEVRNLMEGYKATLALAGMTMDDLVSVTVFCPDLEMYQTFNEVYRSYFKDEFPARAFIGSGPLLFDMRFEMQGIAVK